MKFDIRWFHLTVLFIMLAVMLGAAPGNVVAEVEIHAPTSAHLEQDVTPCTYVISPTGNDANPGTQAQPWKTLLQPFPYSGTGPLQAGDIVCVQPYKDAQGNISAATYGVYYVGIKVSGTATAPIRVVVDANADGYVDTLTGTEPPGGSGLVSVNGRLGIIDQSYVTIEGFTIVGVESMYGLPDYYSATSPWVTSGVWQDLPQRVDSAPAVALPWTDYHWENRRSAVCQKFPAYMALRFGVLIGSDYACNGTFNPPAPIPAQPQWKGWVAGIFLSNTHGVTVRNNTIYRWGTGIILENSPNQLPAISENILENNHFHHCIAGISVSYSEDFIIRRNSFRHIVVGSIGLSPGSHDGLVEADDSQYVGLQHYGVLPVEDEALQVSQVVFRNNVGIYSGFYSVTERNPGSSGLHLGMVGPDVIVESNFIGYTIDEVRADGAGFSVDCTPCGCPAEPGCTNQWGVVFRNNIAYRNMGPGINTSGSYYTTIANNTTVENGYHFPELPWLHFTDVLNGSGIRICFGADKQSKVVNNLLYNDRYGGIDYYERDSQSVFDYNYIAPGSNGVVAVLDQQLVYALPGVAPFGSHNIIGNRSQDILFVDSNQFIGAESGDIHGFHLAPNARVIDAGVATYAPTTDIDGDVRPQGAAYDIGVDESLVSQTVNIPLVAGWNFISLPVQPADPAIAQVLASIAGKYSAVFSYNGCDTADPWKKYTLGAPPYTNDLTVLGVTQGFWINMLTQATLTLTGTPAVNPNIPLCVGWNMLGYPVSTPRTPAEALASVTGKYSMLVTYEATDPSNPWKRYDPAAPPFANTLMQMQAGHAYWLKVTVPCTWIPE